MFLCLCDLLADDSPYLSGNDDAELPSNGMTAKCSNNNPCYSSAVTACTAMLAQHCDEKQLTSVAGTVKSGERDNSSSTTDVKEAPNESVDVKEMQRQNDAVAILASK
jgi:hypothetical protein